MKYYNTGAEQPSISDSLSLIHNSLIYPKAFRSTTILEEPREFCTFFTTALEQSSAFYHRVFDRLAPYKVKTLEQPSTFRSVLSPVTNQQ